MSRIGNKPINVPAGVEVSIDGNHLTVKGPKGTLERDIHKNITVSIDGNVINVTRPNDEAENRSLHGLQIVGVGYRAQKQGNKLVMNLGYSHPVEMEEPTGITFDVPNANTIIVRGIDKEVVGQTAAVVRTKRPPEVYHGKGIKYAEEHIRRKEGKAGKK